jgi:uncharacterized membrane protein
MDDFSRVLLVLHFLGLSMGMSMSWAAIATKGNPPPALTRIADVGLILLWVTGLTLVFRKWGGFAVMPWYFHVKLTLVVILTGIVGFVHSQRPKAMAGDKAAMARIQAVGRVAFITVIGIVIFAVWTFD